MKLTTLLTLGCSLTLAACGGPERAPHQPIAGVDRSHPENANPHDSRGEPAAEPFLGDLPRQVVAAYQARPGVVAVFPALTHDKSQDRNIVNGLGEYIAEETASGLVESKVSVLGGSDLVNALRGANTRLGAYASTADAIALGELLKAEYVISGRVDLRTLEIHKRDQSLDIDWLCRRVSDGEVVARYRAQLVGGALANQLIRYYGLDGEWESWVRQDGPPAGTGP